jgi:hypothetical protein
MKKVEFCQAIGKTIAKVIESYDNDMYITFTDGTYAYVKAKEEYGSTSLTEYHDTLSPRIQVDIGMITPDEEKTIYQKQMAEREEQQRKSDLAQLASLRRKYPDA